MPGTCKLTGRTAGQDFKLPERERESSEDSWGCPSWYRSLIFRTYFWISEKWRLRELRDLNVTVLLDELSLILFSFFFWFAQHHLEMGCVILIFLVSRYRLRWTLRTC